MSDDHQQDPAFVHYCLEKVMKSCELEDQVKKFYVFSDNGGRGHGGGARPIAGDPRQAGQQQQHQEFVTIQTRMMIAVAAAYEQKFKINEIILARMLREEVMFLLFLMFLLLKCFKKKPNKQTIMKVLPPPRPSTDLGYDSEKL